MLVAREAETRALAYDARFRRLCWDAGRTAGRGERGKNADVDVWEGKRMTYGESAAAGGNGAPSR